MTWIWCLVTLLVSTAGAQTRPGVVTATPIRITESQETRERRIEAFMERKAAFFVEGYSLLAVLHLGAFKAVFKDWLTSLVLAEPTKPILRFQVSPDLGATHIDVWHQVLKLRIRYDSIPYRKFPSRAEAELFIDRLIDPNLTDAARVRRNIFRFKNEFVFAFTADVWPLLKRYQRTTAAYPESFPVSEDGLALNLTYGLADDLAALAARFAGGRDPRPIERYLRRKLALNQGRPVTMPLQNILHPFVRRKINTFEPTEEVTCHQAAFAVGHGWRTPGPSMSESCGSSLAAFLNERHARIEIDSSWRTGDHLAYSEGTSLIHSASLVDEHFVFTKNGYSHLSPYVFQRREDVESIYFRGRPFELVVSRSNGSAVDGPRLVPNAGLDPESIIELDSAGYVAFRDGSFARRWLHRVGSFTKRCQRALSGSEP